MDHKEFMWYSEKMLLQIKSNFANGHNIKVHLDQHDLMVRFIEHISKDKAVFMTAPDYIIQLAKKIAAIPPVEVTVSP